MQRPRSHRAWVFLLGCVIAGAFGAACEVVSHSSDFQTATTATDAVTCPATELLCTSDAGPSCIDPTSDSRNCGACGAACASNQVCNAGTCGCATGQTSCSGACVDTTSSPANCGACGTACGANHICIDGKCEAQCPTGFENCNDQCVDVATSPDNCGACMHSCGSNATCTTAHDAGAVTYDCCVGCKCDTDAGLTQCMNGPCTDLTTDPNNCGSCGTVCGSGATCTAGACVCPQTSGQKTIYCGSCEPCTDVGADTCTSAASVGLPGLVNPHDGGAAMYCGCAMQYPAAPYKVSGRILAEVCCDPATTKVEMDGGAYECCANGKGISICCPPDTLYCGPGANGPICKASCP